MKWNSIRCAMAGLLAAMSASATRYVDYEIPGTTLARAPDADTLFGDTWNFSDTIALVSDSDGQNATLYGGMITSWSVSTNYIPTFGHIASAKGFQVQISDLGGTQTAKGAWVWNQADFLNGGDEGTVSLGPGSAINVHIMLKGTTEYRAVLNQGDTYYVSEISASDGGDIFSLDPTTVNWAPLNTSDYTYGAFTALSLDDVRGVGVWFDQSGNGLIRFRVNEFQLDVITENKSTLGLIAF